MSARPRCQPYSISFRPRVLRALKHYARVRALAGPPIGDHYSISSVANELLAHALTRVGFDPATLRLVGEARP